jgi:Fe-only nitrogenase accessory protein AnfO
LKIAVLLDGAGKAAGLQEGGTIYVFERKNDVWSSDVKLDFLPAGFASMAELRSYIGSISRRLGDCKILAAKASNGFYRVVFEGFGVGLWAVTGIPQQFISRLEAFYVEPPAPPETAAGQEAAAPSAFITPIPGKTGYYRADLRKVMEHRAGVNSREVLLPFFRHTPFTRLELVCDHVPRWFERELPALKLRADAESAGRIVNIHVYHQ